MILKFDYIAGLIDADGCFTISILPRKTKNSSFVPSFVVNFRQDSLYSDVVKSVQETLDRGQIYRHSDNMLTWQTSNWKDTLDVCENLYSYLHIKQKTCGLMIETIKEWWNPKNINLSNKRLGKPVREKWLVEKVLKAAVNMNKSRQSETLRNQKFDRIEQIRKNIISSYS